MGKDKEKSSASNGWFNCATLARGNEFSWKYDEDGGLIIESGIIQARFSIDDINTVIDHVYNIKEGVPLGSAATGDVPINSIGWLLENKKKKSFSRPWCSYLAAILVDEGICSHENLGRGPGRGVWLFPDTDDISIKAIENLNNNIEHDNQDIQFPLNDLFENDCSEFDYSNIFQQVSNELVSLSKKVISAEIKERKCIKFQFSELNSNLSNSLRRNIREWEKQYPESLYIYIYKVSKEVDLKQVNSKYSLSRETNVGNRAFARINKDNRNSNVLYVGCSRSIGQRTKDHLGFSSKKVFSLQIYHWSQDLAEGCELEILRFPSTTAYDVIQTIEDGLWDIHKPMFGRQGKR